MNNLIRGIIISIVSIIVWFKFTIFSIILFILTILFLKGKTKNEKNNQR